MIRLPNPEVVMSNALRFAEEIILLLLDDRGRFAKVPDWSVSHAMAGGVLMDLALENRIDTDLDSLILLDSTPVGDSLLDETLADIAGGGRNDARYWVEHTVGRADSIRSEAIGRLVSRGILERRDERFLWVFRSLRYPTVDDAAELEVKHRVMDVLFSDDIPDPRDVVTICLADACGIFDRILAKPQLQRASARIEQVRKLDLIGQAMSQAIEDIEISVAASVHPYIY